VSCDIARTVSGPFDGVVADVMSQLKKRVLTDIDVQGHSSPRSESTCPGIASLARAIQTSPSKGSRSRTNWVLPCNVNV